jgi:hypothetical protein
MDIQGRIIAVVPARSGVSQRTGNPWTSQDFVIETHDQYPRKCCFSVFGEDRIKQFNINVGDELMVSFDIDAHEYQGRWYNSIRAYAVQRVDPAAAHAGTPAPAAAPQPAPAAAPQAQPTQQTQAPFPPADNAGDSTDDLPF